MTWHGAYLSEDEIVADMLAKITADPIAMQRWLDPWSWRLPLKNGRIDPNAPPYAGCLTLAGMHVRNYYGLWHEACPYSRIEDEDLEIVDGVIVDARFPDNISRRVIDRVRDGLAAHDRERAN
ncbi:MAG: hypothetical protein ACM31O_03380 [Bacteroidota bacterium]